MIEQFAFVIGLLLVLGALGAWAIALYRYWGEREPYRGVKGGGHLPASHRWQDGS